MTSTQTPTPVIARITNHLPLVEKILLMALAVGAILTVMGNDSTVTRISLLGLGVTLVVPKVLWISSAVSAVGISMYLFDLGNNGYKQMLLIGAASIGIGTVLLLIFLLSGVKHIRLVTSVLLRAIPLFLVDVYLLFN